MGGPVNTPQSWVEIRRLKRARVKNEVGQRQGYTLYLLGRHYLPRGQCRPSQGVWIRATTGFPANRYLIVHCLHTAAPVHH